MILAPTLSASAGSGAAIVRPTFSRDFAGEKTLNNGTGPAITFTRGTNATFFDASGTLRFAPHNAIRNSQAGGSTNGVIGSGGVPPTNWAVTPNANGVTSEVVGTGSDDGLAYIDIKISGTPTVGGGVQIRVEPDTQVVATSGQTWTHSAFVRLVAGSAANATFAIIARGNVAAGSGVSGQQVNTTFVPTSSALSAQRRAATVTFTNATVERVMPFFGIDYTSGNPINLTLRIAAPQLERNATPSEYVPTTGTANFDQPRFDHSSTGSSLGLLIEESRTNHCTNSEASGSIGATGPTGWVVDANGALGLARTITTGVVNGMSYMDVRFNGTTTSGGNMRFDPRPSAGASASSGQAWTASAYIALQAGTIPAGAQMKLIARGRDSSDLATEDTQTNITLTSSLTRYVATRTLSVANTARVTHDIRLESVPTATAVDFTLRIAAPQLEQGAFPTSYIPTTTAAATRSADSAVVTPISSFYNQSEGTLFAEGRQVVDSASQDQIAFVDDNTLGNRIGYICTTANKRVEGRVVAASVQQDAFASASNTTLGAPIIKVGLAYKANDMAFATGFSSTVQTDSSATIPSSLTHLRIGENASGGRSAIYIRKIAYYPKRLSNTLLQQLTT